LRFGCIPPAGERQAAQAIRGPADHLAALDQFVHGLRLLQRAHHADQRKHLTARHQIERFQHLTAGDVAAAEQVLLLVEHVGRRRLERLARAAKRDEAPAPRQRLGASFKR
jgi:hypothetical protein